MTSNEENEKDNNNNSEKLVPNTMKHRAFMLNHLKQKYKRYVDDPLCVYGLCPKKWLVIMSKVIEKNPKLSIKTMNPGKRQKIYCS